MLTRCEALWWRSLQRRIPKDVALWFCARQVEVSLTLFVGRYRGCSQVHKFNLDVMHTDAVVGYQSVFHSAPVADPGRNRQDV